MKEYSDNKKVEDLDPRVLSEAIEIARKLQSSSSEGNFSEKDLTQHKKVIAKLLEYLICKR